MARILFTTTLGTSAWAGSEELWFQAAARLGAEGHEVAACLPKHMRTLANEKRLVAVQIRPLAGFIDGWRSLATRLSRRFTPTRPTRLSAVVCQARRWRADLVVISQASCWGAYSEMLALAEAGIPYGCISQLNTPFSWPGDRLFEAVGDAFAKARFCVFVSEGNRKLFENQVARELSNACVIYNPPSFPVDEPCLAPPPQKPFTLLNVARIDPAQKGQDLLLDVLSMPKWRQRDVRLEIAGGGNRRWLERLIAVKGLKNILLLGQVGDLRAAWERATFGIFPSRFEGMPLAMVEGMALGRPVIATDVGGHAEWIEDGRNGFLAEAASAPSLDAAMEKAWLEKERSFEMGENARAKYKLMTRTSPAVALAAIIEAQKTQRCQS